MNNRLDLRTRGLFRRAPSLFSPTLLAALVVLFSAGCAGLPIATGDGAATPVHVTQGGANAIGAAIGGATRGATGAAKETTATPTAKAPTATPPTVKPTASARPADEVVAITLGDTISVKGSGASVDGSTVRIAAAGTYGISGKLKNGQIIVDTKDEMPVKLVLNGVDISCASSAPIYVRRARATIITLADGTKNHLKDGSTYDLDNPQENEPNSTVFAGGNLTLDGTGSLTVEGNYQNGITSKGELNITSGNIAVNAANDGIRGRDYIAIKNGNITVKAVADGMQSNNDVNPEKGFIAIEGGNVDVTSGEDGIQAETSVVISGGTIAVSSGGGSGRNAPANPVVHLRASDRTPSISAKGIKAASEVKIEGGTIRADSSDDAINSKDGVTIDDGNMVLASGDDGIHADSTLTINGGDIRITKSYEAIEGAIIAVNGGNVRLAARDDGVNVSGGHQHASANGRTGRDNFDPSVDKHLTVTGGYVVVDATGDGLDVNGWAKMTGGTIIINGPVVSDNGALDYDREFSMNGGTLVAVGSFGMAQAPDATSTQSSLSVNLGSPQTAGTLVHIEAEDGTAILTFAPVREYQTVVFSSSGLKKGSTYNVYVGGRSTGSVVDGVYSGGAYTPGTRKARPTVSRSGNDSGLAMAGDETSSPPALGKPNK